jgi:hypothetical protein
MILGVDTCLRDSIWTAFTTAHIQAKCCRSSIKPHQAECDQFSWPNKMVIHPTGRAEVCWPMQKQATFCKLRGYMAKTSDKCRSMANHLISSIGIPELQVSREPGSQLTKIECGGDWLVGDLVSGLGEPRWCWNWFVSECMYSTVCL